MTLGFSNGSVVCTVIISNTGCIYCVVFIVTRVCLSFIHKNMSNNNNADIIVDDTASVAM